MKRLYLLVIALAALPFLSIAQLPASLMTDSAANFYQIDSTLEKYYARFADSSEHRKRI